MAEAVTTNDVDLSGYRVKFHRTLIGWVWEATGPDGDEVFAPPWLPLSGLSSATRESAEASALDAIEYHARPNPPLDGEELRRRVRERS